MTTAADATSDGLVSTLWVVAATIGLGVVATALARWFIDRAARSLARNRLASRLVVPRPTTLEADEAEDAARDLAQARYEARTRTLAALSKSVVSFLVLGTTAVLVLSELGINVAPIIASAGVVGIAVGFGAQSLVRDLITGIFVVIEDQYGVGDVVDTGFVTGTVQDLGLRLTTVRDAEGTVWYIPNGNIQRIGNRSKGWGTATVDVPVAVGADLDRATEVLRQATEQLAGSDEWDAQVLDEPPVVGVESMGPQAVTLRVQLRTQPGQQLAVARALRPRLASALDTAGVPAPQPGVPPPPSKDSG